ncbi:phage tail protein [Pseudoalteromonas umbrosa]|uniref:phage tail protein n=1 Tax=Pseudoalteromonas umbrosa TaxID=3048489 RepID=UPI0024C23049|nr:phage tail protein [Pseudoalteromonas sp. B95]MDK1290226.1 hypothetical protein [Pseudoalteromonas sp. B95]
MTERLIDIHGLIPERLRDEPLLKDCIESLEHVFYRREENVSRQIEAIRDKYTTYLVLAKTPAKESFQIRSAPAITEVTPTLYMSEPLIVREQADFSFAVGKHQFSSPILSLESIDEIFDANNIHNATIRQITPLFRNMKEGYFEENCFYEIECETPIAFSFKGLRHGTQAPIEKIVEPLFGLTYESSNLRESDLYALEPDFTYQVHATADGFDWGIDGLRHDPVELDLSRERNAQVVNEYGYQYLIDALGMTALDVALIRSFITVIHQLKGSRKGVDLMLDLLKLRDYVQLIEWWEDDPTGETVTEMTYRAEVDLRNQANFNGNSLQALRLFLRQYVYPLMTDFALIIDFVNERLKTGYNVLTHQTVNGTVSSPLVITPIIRPYQTIHASNASPVMAGMSGLTEREYKVSFNSVQEDVTYQMVDQTLNTGFNVLPHMEVKGQTTTQVIVGMTGIGHTRYHGHTNSPIVVETSGLVDREISMEFKQVATESAINFTFHVANGTKGFVKQSVPAQGHSPMMLMMRGMLDQAYEGQVTGDINDAP